LRLPDPVLIPSISDQDAGAAGNAKMHSECNISIKDLRAPLVTVINAMREGSPTAGIHIIAKKKQKVFPALEDS